MPVTAAAASAKTATAPTTMPAQLRRRRGGDAGVRARTSGAGSADRRGHGRLDGRPGSGASARDDGPEPVPGVPQRRGVEGGRDGGHDTGDGRAGQGAGHAEPGAEGGGRHGGQGAADDLGNGQVQGA